MTTGTYSPMAVSSRITRISSYFLQHDPEFTHCIQIASKVRGVKLTNLQQLCGAIMSIWRSRSLMNVLTTLLNLSQEELRQFWRLKGVCARWMYERVTRAKYEGITFNESPATFMNYKMTHSVLLVCGIRLFGSISLSFLHHIFWFSLLIKK